MSIGSTAKAILGFLEDAGDEAPQFISFITNTVSAAEQTGNDGSAKMAAVLNSAELFVNSAMPQAMAKLQALLKAVSDFVNELVALWNEAGIFVHAITGK